MIKIINKSAHLLIILLAHFLINTSIFAQAPQKMSYQAVIRNSNDSLLIYTPVGMRISLVQGTPTGTVVFSETQTATTNANGLVSIQIGMGTALSGTFANIDWAAGPYYVKTETDLSGGTNYTITSSNEILSVPYALFSANGTPGPVGPIGLTGETGAQGIQGATGLLSSGAVAGNTAYWNGSVWVVNNSNIHNNGAGVGIGTVNPNTSAKLDVESTTQGFLPPRLTTAQRDVIVNPAVGLIIYNTTTNCLNFYVGSGWNETCGTASLPLGVVSTIDCGSATITGTLTIGTAASGVSVIVPYTGGNSGTYGAQSVSSTGVVGLTATLSADSVTVTLANGAGSLIYTITGTPTTSGTATFAITVGGQSCSFTVSVGLAIDQYPAGTVHCAGATTVVDVTNPTTGKIWMDRNLGATQVATSSTDVNSYGDLYQWGRRADGHQCRTSPTTATLSSIDQPAHGNFILSPNPPYEWRSPQNANLWQGVNGINNPCPSGYRIPTETEINAERLSWSQNNSAGAFASPLKWTLAGNRYNYDGSLVNVGLGGRYWSSTLSSTVWGVYSRDLNFDSSDANMLHQHRGDGLTVRCLKDASAIPATLGAINCGSTSITGTLTSGTAASGVSASVPYTGENAGAYAAQNVSSTGVVGLTASLAAGMLANGSGSLSYTITGTPTTSGTATFAITVGGQSCSFTVSVAATQPQYPAGTVHCAGATAVVDVTNPTTGKIWMDRNLGASQVATSSTDVNSYGDLYQWGRRADGHQCRTSPTTATLSSVDQPAHGDFIIAQNSSYDWRSPQNTNLWQGVNGVNNPCPSGYRLPTETEINAERLSWGQNTSSGAFASPLKLPVAGYRDASNGSLGDVGSLGLYWSSTVSGTFSRNLHFVSGGASMLNYYRAIGFSVRCIKDASVIPATLGAINCGSTSITGTLTSGIAASGVSASVPYTGGNGGSYAAQTISSTGVTGLTATLSAGSLANGAGSLTYTITGTPTTSGTATFAITVGGQSCSFTVSVSDTSSTYPVGTVHCTAGATAVVDVTNPTTGKIWMDRNLGATQVATSSTDVNSYGDLYQWGRRADGHQCRTSASTSTLSSSDQPAHGDFIITPNSPYDWRSPQNTNLWQGVNGINNPCPSGYRLPTETEINAERLSWGQNTSSGAFASPLKLPMAGGRSYYSSGSLFDVGINGIYWSSTVSGTGSRFLYFFSSSADVGVHFRAYGFSVRCLKDASAIPATLGAINCGSATQTGNLYNGSVASGVSVTVPYTAGNGGSYAAQTISSTGVTGLTATLSAGSLANGAGSLTYTITGTPTTSGTASFAITEGGQSCSFTVSVSDTSSTYPVGTVHCTAGATAVVDVTNPTTGKIWMDRNLGATQVATSSTDANSYGDLYQWGRRADGHQCRTSPTTATLSSVDQPAHGNFILATSAPWDWRSPQSTNLWQGVNGVNNPCPSGYRIPTETEINAERLSWSQNTSAGAFASPLKLPVAGYRYFSNGSLGAVGTYGYYWSSTVGTNSRRLYFSFDSSIAAMNDDYRAHGFSVRCIKDASVIPASLGAINCGSTSITGTLTIGTAASGVSVIVPYTGGNAGTYAAQTISSIGVTGLTATLSAGSLANGAGSLTYTITGTPTTSGTASFAITEGGQSCAFTVSVSDTSSTYPVGTVHCTAGATAVVDVTNPTTGKIWMDRNLGATQVATSSTDAASYGDLYQWGRRADGHQCRTSASTSTLSSIDQPAHGDFIIAPNSPYDWRSPQNTNLWQGVNGINNPCPSGYRLPTETELEAERLSWSQNNSVGAYSSLLKLPMAGIRGSISIDLNQAAYWSSTPMGYDSRFLNFSNNHAYVVNPGGNSNLISVRCIKENVGALGTLNCGGAATTGTLINGTAASGVSTAISYTGGNAGAYAAQNVSSTGVVGLTASLAAGMLANGAGSLIYTITGTPTTSGTASFAITEGGQSCSFTVSVSDTSSTYPVGTVHCTAGATAVVDVTNPTTGKIWMDRNLGATQVATSSTDANSYGDLYQWGRRADGHQCRTSASTSTLSSVDQPAHGDFIIAPNSPYDWRSPQNTNLWQGVNGVNNPCPSGYRIPTETEINSERLSWSQNTSAGAFSSPLKLPMAGRRGYSNGSLSNVGSGGRCWSSTVSGTSSRHLYFSSSSAYMYDYVRAYGFSVRCLKDTTSAIPATLGAMNCGSASITGTLTSGIAASGVSASVPYTGGNAGAYAAQNVSSTGVVGLTASLAAGMLANGAGSLSYTITGTPTTSGSASFAITEGGQSCAFTVSVSDTSSTYPAGTVHCTAYATAVVDVTNPTTGKIWMDRNLGATQVATSSTDANSYGDLYQWGRRADGHQCRTSASTSTLSSIDQPAHGDFIIAQNSSYDWRSPQNANLWQGVNGINNPCPSGYRLPTETELEAERLSWSQNNSVGAFASPLKLPMAGGRDGSVVRPIDNVGSGGFYWSSSVSGADSTFLLFFSSNAYMNAWGRASGISVRCLKD